MSYMTTLAIHRGAVLEGPKLRLLPKRGDLRRRSELLEFAARPADQARPAETRAPRSILIAGGNAGDRQAVLSDLRRTMPGGTTFTQVEARWEVLARAAESSMVVLSGELDDVPAESLMQMLAHRHPALPVVSVDATPCAA
jgi:hypothetical protein